MMSRVGNNVWVNNLKKKKTHNKFTLAGMTDTCGEKTICETEVEADMDKVIEKVLELVKCEQKKDNYSNMEE